MNVLLSSLVPHGLKQIKENQFICKCPVHGEKTPSLSIKVNDEGKTICHCFGCGANGLAVVQSLGLPANELFPDNDDFNHQEYKRKKTIQFQRDQFMKDYRLIVLGHLWIKQGKQLTDKDIYSIRVAKKRIYDFKFDPHEVYKKMIAQDASHASVERAFYQWQRKTLEEKYS